MGCLIDVAIGHADIWFAFPDKTNDEDEIRLHFDWAPALMSQLGSRTIDMGGDPTLGNFDDRNTRAPQMLTFALPHHQERLVSTPESTNKIVYLGCTPTLHGQACPVLGTRWSLVEHLHK